MLSPYCKLLMPGMFVSHTDSALWHHCPVLAPSCNSQSRNIPLHRSMAANVGLQVPVIHSCR